MTPDSKKPAARRISSANNSRSGVPRVVKRTTLREESRGTPDSTVSEQVSALKKIPQDRIATNELEIKTAEITARLREVLSENVRLTSVANTARKEAEKYRQLNEKVVAEVKRAVDARNESEQQRLEADNKIEKLQSEIQTMRRELSRRAQPGKRTEYLRIQPAQMAEMITDFEKALSESLAGLILKDLELRLKVAVDTEEDEMVLLLPPISKGKIKSDDINELVLRVLPSGVTGIP